MNDQTPGTSRPEKPHRAARKKFLELSLESTRKSYYPQLKEQLERAKDNQKRLRLLIDNLPAQISYINSQEQYVFVNREFEKAFGLGQDQVIGRPLKKILGRKMYDDVKVHVKNALSGESGKFELSISTQGSAVKWYETNYVAQTDRDGHTSGFYLFTIDLTDKKHAEEERLRLKDRLRHSQKMEAIGTLSGGIAHDFNNILSGIFGYSQLIDIHGNETKLVRHYNKKIFEGAKRASELIQQILAFSRQTQFAKHRIVLKMIIKEAVSLLRSTIPSNIEIHTNLISKSMVWADPIQIHQVVMNLCTNAYHAMGDESGLLTVSLEDVGQLPSKAAKDAGGIRRPYLKLSICDTGPGIEDDIKEKIFDPYFTTKEMDRGTGLGLAVVAGIVKKHNGIIDFETRLGSGSNFYIYLPVSSEPHGQVDNLKTREKAVFAGNEKIMLVDDEQAILKTLETILSGKGYRISAFSNGESALRAFAENPDDFDMIITDMTMPRMNGDKLAMKAMKLRKDIPVIICTGYHEKFKAEDAVRAGIRKYLQKPLTASQLTRTIREVFDAGPPEEKTPMKQ